MSKYALIGINSKYIHPNLAIRYLQVNCECPVEIKEFLIKDSIEKIANTILEKDYDVIGFSVYIWNFEIFKEVVIEIKKRKPSCIIFAGGPEITYEDSHIFKEIPLDYICKDEGEESVNLFFKAIDNKDYEQIKRIPGFCGIDFDNPAIKPDIKKIKLPYLCTPFDYSHQIMYVELSRGCAFNCSYCLASLDKCVRFFNINDVKDSIKELIQRGGKTFKFLDRNFILKEKEALEMFEFLLGLYKPGLSFQFEVNLDKVSQKLLDFCKEKIPPSFFRFEVGIQTLNESSNELVNRHQNNSLLIHNILFINNETNVDLHCDLIAGLPTDNFQSFHDTFDDVLRLNPKELQLGFLKFLKGTELRKYYQKYGYVFDQKAPYEIQYSNSFSKEDLQIIHDTEDVLNVLYNNGFMKRTMKKLISLIPSSFDFFYHFYNEYKGRYKNTSLDTLYHYFDEFIHSYNLEHELYNDMLMDYFSYFKVKPKAWMKTELSKQEKNLVLRSIFESQKTNYNLNQLFRHANVYKTLENDTYFIAIYEQNHSNQFFYKMIKEGN